MKLKPFELCIALVIVALSSVMVLGLTQTVTFKIVPPADFTPPSVTITEVKYSGAAARALEITFASDEDMLDESCMIDIDGIALKNCPKNLQNQKTQTFSSPLDDADVALKLGEVEGTKTLSVSVQDFAKNRGYGRKDISIDTKPPMIFEPTPTSYSRGKAQTVFGVKISDKGSGVKKSAVKFWIVKDGAKEDKSGALAFQDTANFIVASYTLPADMPTGNYVLRFEAADMFGNNKTFEWPLAIDDTFPVEPVISVEGNVMRDSIQYTKIQKPKINISYTASPEAIKINSLTVAGVNIPLPSCTLSENGKELLQCPTDAVPIPAFGKVALEVSAQKKIDDANYGTAATFKFSFFVDTVPPTLSVTLPKINNAEITKTANRELLLGYTYNDNYIDRIVFDGNISAVTKYASELISGKETAATQVVLLSEEDGNKPINVTAYDSAGNFVRVQKSIMLDRVLPEIAVTEVLGGQNNVVIKEEDVYKTKADTVTVSGTYKKQKQETVEIYQHGYRDSRKAQLLAENDERGTFRIDIPLPIANRLEQITLLIVDISSPAAIPGTVLVKLLKDNEGPIPTVVEPPYTATNQNEFTLKIATNEAAEKCSATYRPPSNIPRTEPMASEGGKKLFSIKTTQLSINTQIPFEIECVDSFANTKKTTVYVTIDTINPLVSDFSLTWPKTPRASTPNRKEYFITSVPETQINTITDEETLCRYSTEKKSYYEMTPEDNFEDTEVFKKDHVSRVIRFPDKVVREYFISCRDKAGNAVEGQYSIVIDVQNNAPIIISKLFPPHQSTTPNRRQQISFETDIKSDCVLTDMSDKNIFGKITDKRAGSADKKAHTFPATAAGWPQEFANKTSYSFAFKCTDAENKVRKDATPQAEFTVDTSANPPDVPPPLTPVVTPPPLTLVAPKFGVSSEAVFDITVEIDEVQNIKENGCRYKFGPLGGFEFMDIFSSTSGRRYTITNYDKISPGDTAVHTLNVRCINLSDGKEEFIDGKFDITVDTTKPVITSFVATPAVVSDPLREARIAVQTDDQAICKYAKDTPNYPTMDKFPGFDTPDFKTVHDQRIVLPGSEPGEYRYYAICENKARADDGSAGLLSDARELVIKYDPNLALTITQLTERYFNGTPNRVRDVDVRVETSRAAECRYTFGNKQELLQTTDLRKVIHTSKLAGLGNGTHTVSVECEDLKKEKKSLTVTFTVDDSPPVMEFVDDDGETTCVNASLKAKWKGSDVQSGIKQYEYMVLDKRAGRPIIPWTESTVSDEWVRIEDLNLSNGVSYAVSVRPYNGLTVAGSAKESNGIIVDATRCKKDCAPNDAACKPLPTCQEQGNCPKDTVCKDNSDCRSRYCSPATKKCAEPSCSDTVRNGDESDVDCGGSCRPCAIGKGCSSKDANCGSGNCANGKCSEPDPCKNRKLDAVETDIDCGGRCVARCGIDDQCEGDLDCEDSLSCVDNVCAKKEDETGGAGDGVPVSTEKDSDNDGMSDEWEMKFGLNPNSPDDAQGDADNDLLTNLMEFQKKTDPLAADSDDDGFTDKEELDAKTNPNDKLSFPKAGGGFILPLIIGILVMLIGGIAVVILLSRPKSPPPQQSQMRAPPPYGVRPQQRPMQFRRPLPVQGPPQGRPRIPPPPTARGQAGQPVVPVGQPQPLPSKPTPEKPQQKEEDVFSKLAAITKEDSKKKSGVKTEDEKPTDIYAKLAQVTGIKKQAEQLGEESKKTAHEPEDTEHKEPKISTSKLKKEEKEVFEKLREISAGKSKERGKSSKAASKPAAKKSQGKRKK